MAKFSVRYLVQQPGPAGQLPRWFWQPSSAMRKEGWRPQRVPLNWQDYVTTEALEAAAIARAQELNAELDAARIGRALIQSRPPAPPQRTVGELIKLYQQSKDWTAKAAKTQRGYLQCLKLIESWAGDMPVRAIGAKDVQTLAESMSNKPAYANATVRVLRLLLAYGRRQGWITINPAERPNLHGTTPTGLIWPREAVQAFIAAADALGRHSMGTAVMLNEWLGQREGDILRMPRFAMRNGTLIIRQSKTENTTGATVHLPLDMVPALEKRLAEELARSAERERLSAARAAKVGLAAPKPPIEIIISEQTGQPYAEDNFRHVFAQVRAKAAEIEDPDLQLPGWLQSGQPAPPEDEDGRVFEIDHLMPGRNMRDPKSWQIRMRDLTFMALRHTAVTRLAEAGCDTTLISSITGHSQATVAQLMSRYMVRTGEMARQAFQKRLDAEQQAADLQAEKKA